MVVELSLPLSWLNGEDLLLEQEVDLVEVLVSCHDSLNSTLLLSKLGISDLRPPLLSELLAPSDELLSLVDELLALLLLSGDF